MPDNRPIKRVIFVQKFVPHYRLPLFELLKRKLEENGIEFVLIYGSPDPYEGSKVKMEFPEWGVRVESKIIPIYERYLYWQGIPFKIKKDDVVIVEQAAKLLDNYILFFLEQINIVRMCYFGHGQNFQDKYELKISKKIKQLMVGRVSKWFAYTKMSVDSLLEQGVNSEKIVSVNNTLKLTTTLREFDIKRNKFQFVYIGGLYKDKRTEFLLESSSKVRAENSRFELHIVGDGPQKGVVEEFSRNNSWCFYHKGMYGEERDRLLFESSAILMPGLVGLVAIDSFHFACPIVTTNCGQHSPEFVYLENRKNALMLSDEGTTDEFAKLILEFIVDQELSETLRRECRNSAAFYTIEETAERFYKGIMSLA